MHRVDSAVTKKVAHVLIRTMRPLKRVLHEQQVKIELLQKEKNKEKEEEQKMASALADKLKNGLLSHLKKDVDIEVKRKLTPKLLLKYEKSKAKLRHKLLAFKAKQAREAKTGRKESADVRLAVTHSMTKALTGVLKRPTHTARSSTSSSTHSPAPTHKPATHRKIPPPVVKEPKMTSVQANVAKEISNAKDASGKKRCDPLAGLYKTGLVSWC